MRDWPMHFRPLGAVHKVRHARGEGNTRRWDSLWDGRVVKSMCDVTLLIFYHTYETWNWRWRWTFCYNRCRPILKEGGTDKIPPRTKPTTQKTREQLRYILYRVFRLFALPKWGGSEMCDVRFWWSRDVWQSVTEGGGQNWPKIAWRAPWLVSALRNLDKEPREYYKHDASRRY